MHDILQASAQYTDSDYRSDEISKYRISIQLRLDGFSFAAIDPKNLKILQVQDYKLIEKTGLSHDLKWIRVQEYFSQFISQNIFLSGLPKKVNIVIDHKEYTVIPESLFNREEIKQQLSFNQEIAYPFQAFANRISGTDRVLIGAIHQSLHLAILDSFDEVNIFHSSSVLQEEIYKIHKNQKIGKRLYVSVALHDMQILAMENENLLYSNSFAFTSKEDFVYFILLAYDQLEMNAEQDSLYFLGDINRTSAIYQICWQYIRNIHFVDQAIGLTAESGFDNMPISQFFILIKSTLCES